jgi:hypothetical protein
MIVRTGQPRVLLVEDEPAQRTVLAYNLEAEGFAVTQADNGEDAMVLVDEEDPDIIIGYNIFGFDYEFMFRRAEPDSFVNKVLAQPVISLLLGGNDGA